MAAFNVNHLVLFCSPATQNSSLFFNAKPNSNSTIPLRTSDRFGCGTIVRWWQDSNSNSITALSQCRRHEHTTYAACASKKQFILDTLNTTLNNNFAATNKRKYILCIQYEKSISTETKSTHFTLVSFSYIYTEMRLNDDPPKWKIVNTAFIKKDTKKCKVTRYN